MKRVLFLIVFSFVFFSFFSKQVFAIGLMKDFAGQIVDKKATKIRILESSSYKCVVPGKTIQIIKVGVSGYEPLSYFIPFSTLAKWRTPLNTGKQIMGQYSVVRTPIVCTNGTSAQTVMLPTVTSFGTPAK